MAWGSSYKHFKSVSFQPLKDRPFAEWEYAKKELLFASNFDLDIAAPELWKYKHNYKKNFRSRRMAEWNALPHSMAFAAIDFSAIKTYITTTGGVVDFHAVFFIEDKYKKVLSIEDENHTVDNIFNQLMIDNSAYKYKITHGSYLYYSSTNVTNPYNGEFRYRYENHNIVLSSDKSEITMTYRLIEFLEVEDDDGNITMSANDRGLNSITLDARRYYYARAYYLKDSDHDDFNDYCYVPHHFYLEIYTEEVINSFQFAPLITILQDDHPDVDPRKQKQMLRDISIDLDAIKEKIADETIDDYRVTLAAAPDDCTKYEVISKYFADFFEEVGGETGIVEAAGIQRNRSFEFSLNEVEIKLSFNLEEETISGLIPKGNAHEYKVRLKQAISNSVFYYESMKKIYEDNIGGSGGKTTTDMYKECLAWYREDKEESARKKMYASLPPADCGRESLGNSYAYYYGEVADMEEGLDYKLHADIGDEEHVRTHNIESYRIHRVLSTADAAKYHSEKLEPFEEFIYAGSDEAQISGPYQIKLSEDGQTIIYYKAVKYVKAIFYKQISPTEYKKFTYMHGRLEYTSDGRTATLDHEKTDGTFRFYMLDGKLDGLSFKEYTSLFDSCLCGVAFSYQKVEVRWYQTRAFQVIVTIVAIVITIASAGTLAGLAYGLVAAAAVSIIAKKIAEEIGGTAGAIIGTIVAIVLMIVIGQIDVENTAQLWLTSSSTAISMYSSNLAIEAKEYQEAYNKAREKIDIYAMRLSESIEEMGTKGHSKEAIIAKLANSYQDDGYFLNSEVFTEEFYDAADRHDWKLQEVKPIDYNLMDTKWSEATEIPNSVYEYDDVMITSFAFGDTTNGPTVI